MLLEPRKCRKVPDLLRQWIPYLRANVPNRMLPMCNRIKSRYYKFLVPEWIFGVCPVEKVSNVFRTNIILNLVHKTSHIL